MYDAAEVDGASVWHKVWHVTMPHLRGVLFITLILQIIGTAQVFLEPFLFTNGGPNHATETIMLRVYNLAFASLGNDFGQATALSLHARRVPRRHVGGLLPGHPLLEYLVTTTVPLRRRSSARLGGGRRSRIDRRVIASVAAASQPGGGRPRRPLDRGLGPATVKYTWRAMHLALLILLVVGCLGPLLLLVKFAFTPTRDILSAPLAWFPNGATLRNVEQALVRYHIGRYFLNTVWVALGSWAVQILVATTGGFVLSVLRPRWASVVNVLVIGTLLVPAVVLLIPLYKIIVAPPIGPSPDRQLPRRVAAGRGERVQRRAGHPVLRFAAAGDLRRGQVDGAGPFRLFWSVVLPMSKPIIGVVSVFAVIASWKDFLWPFLVLKSDSVKPLSVYLQSMANVDKGTLMAALAISTLIPVAMFLIFQRMFLRGAGLVARSRVEHLQLGALSCAAAEQQEALAVQV